MSILNRIKDIGVQRLLASLALIGAIYTAYGAGSTLTWPGIAYYTICIAALLFIKHPRVAYLLWLAVLFHIIISVGYQLWLWETQESIPCIYCFSTAGFVLIAAVVMYRLPVALLPALLLAGMLYAWPYVFAFEPEAVSPPAEVQPAASPAALKPAAAGIATNNQDGDKAGSGETGPAKPTETQTNNASTGSDSPQVTPPEQENQPDDTTPPGETPAEVATPPQDTVDNAPPGAGQTDTTPAPGTGSGTDDEKPKPG